MLTNWKTTIMGILVGVANLGANGMTWKQIAISVGVAALGAFAKDFDQVPK